VISATDGTGRSGDADIRHAPAPAITDDKPPDNHDDHPRRLGYEQVVSPAAQRLRQV
jgi:hypothetical protein